MTRRERAEARLERRREWAAGRAAKAEGLFARGDKFRGDHAFNTQPGHIPERARVLAAHDRGCEHLKVAAHHEAKALGLERQLATTIFSDDADAVEALRAKAAGLTARRDEAKRLNSWWRRRGTMSGCPGVTDAEAAAWDADIPTRYTWERKGPTRPYELTSLSAEIRRCAARIAEIERQSTLVERADAAGGCIVEGGDFVRVTFAATPERSVIDSLKSADFRFSGGSWLGERAKLPAGIAP